MDKINEKKPFFHLIKKFIQERITKSEILIVFKHITILREKKNWPQSLLMTSEAEK